MLDTIAYIEFLFKKQRHSKVRWVTAKVNNLKQQLFYGNLLPKTVVDSYCLFREDMNNLIPNLEQNAVSLALGLSLNMYTGFRKSFDDTFRQVRIFF